MSLLKNHLPFVKPFSRTSNSLARAIRFVTLAILFNILRKGLISPFVTVCVVKKNFVGRLRRKDEDCSNYNCYNLSVLCHARASRISNRLVRDHICCRLVLSCRGRTPQCERLRNTSEKNPLASKSPFLPPNMYETIAPIVSSVKTWKTARRRSR
jgi:hypothetical protein